MNLTGKKQRADKVMVELGLVENRSRAQALIMAGKVFNGEIRIKKAGEFIKADANLSVRPDPQPWVSRGGVKLEHGLTHFMIEVKDCICMDIGASTGGFTDVLLQKGASKVYAVDVGKGQLDWKLRRDSRIVVLENTNARFLSAEQVPELADLIVCDASFIGIEKVLSAPLSLAKPTAHLIALIKPQFQAGRQEVGKGGVVRDPEVHTRVCLEVENWLTELGWQVLGLTKSPITGPKGNIEFLIAANRNQVI